jgi:RNA-directed DNA polymerase
VAEEMRAEAVGSGSKKEVPRRKWHSLWGQICDRRNLQAAWKLVLRNHGSPGSDGETIEEFRERADEELTQLESELRDGTYQPHPVRRVMIPKPDGTQRPLGIPAVRDRVAGQAALNVLGPLYEGKFSDASHGYRPGRGDATALHQVCVNLREGYVHVVDLDIEKYFDSIPHEPLLDAVAEDVADGTVLRFLRKLLTAPVQDGARRYSPEQGTPQGGVISPLLANLYLHPLDEGFADFDVRVVRYADDALLMTRSPSMARKAQERAKEILEGRLGLRVNARKTQIVTLWKGIPYLGFILQRWRGRIVAWVKPKALDRFRERVRELTKRTLPVSVGELIRRLSRYLRGWGTYFTRATNWNLFRKLDKWVARRIWSFIAKRWRNGVWHRYPMSRLFGQCGPTNLTDMRAARRRRT